MVKSKSLTSLIDVVVVERTRMRAAVVAAPVTVQLCKLSLGVPENTDVHVPLGYDRLIETFTVPVKPTAAQRMLCVEPIVQFSPPMGEITVTPLMVKFALLVSPTFGKRSDTTRSRPVSVPGFVTVHV